MTYYVDRGPTTTAGAGEHVDPRWLFVFDRKNFDNSTVLWFDRKTGVFYLRVKVDGITLPLRKILPRELFGADMDLGSAWTVEPKDVNWDISVSSVSADPKMTPDQASQNVIVVGDKDFLVLRAGAADSDTRWVSSARWVSATAGRGPNGVVRIPAVTGDAKGPTSAVSLTEIAKSPWGTVVQ
jgi:hypothetical protein